MLLLLRDLFAHQQWADSVHWRALGAHSGALEDGAIRPRLYHLHAVQRGFLDVWKGTPKRPRPLESYSSMEELRREVRSYYDDLARFLGEPARSRLEEPLRVPWFPDPQRPIRMFETMHQVILHSEHHRGQNATRLRELGGTPPPTDYIVWILDGRPAPSWD